MKKWEEKREVVLKYVINCYVEKYKKGRNEGKTKKKRKMKRICYKREII